MLKLYFGLFENRWISAPRRRGNPTPQIPSDAAATAFATWASSEPQSRWGAKLNVVLPSASVLQEKTPNADWMIAGYTSWQKNGGRTRPGVSLLCVARTTYLDQPDSDLQHTIARIQPSLREQMTTTLPSVHCI